METLSLSLQKHPNVIGQTPFWLYFFIELTFLNEILRKHVKLYYNYEKENKNPNLTVINQNLIKEWK